MDHDDSSANFPKLRWENKTIRDPIWGDIGITEVEKKIIQTPAFSRLRGIKQLSFAYLSFPGAVHSRFEHSIGVMHVADQILKILIREDDGIAIESEHRQLLRLAALLHDIGHAPFSHAIENLFNYYPKLWEEIQENFPDDFKEIIASGDGDKNAPKGHEDFSEYIICTDLNIRKVLIEWYQSIHKTGMKTVPEQEDGFIRDVIAKLAIGKEVVSENVDESYKDVCKIFKNIMSGDIDADKIDYLARDNYYCGLPYQLDLNSLRGRLIIDKGKLVLLPDGIKFVNTVVLARYFLITQVHQESWDTFTTDKAIELLYTLLKNEKDRTKRIMQIFTEWQDARLLQYIFDESKDTAIQEILTTQYPLQEICRLECVETHPYIRETIQVLSENFHHIPELQSELRKMIGRDDIFVHIHRIKSPDFEMKVRGGNLLRNEILRGISEESIKNLHIVVYGPEKASDINYEKLDREIERMPEQNEQIDEYVKNLGRHSIKKLLAFLSVQRYRKICQETAQKQKILAPDFLFFIMDAIQQIQNGTTESEYFGPTRQIIYKVAKLIYNSLSADGIDLHGSVSMKHDAITPSFYREIRKYEQMGLVSYSRNIKPLEDENLPDEQKDNRQVFRFDRRFKLNEYGRAKLEKIQNMREVPEYVEYLKLCDKISNIVEENKARIEEILGEEEK